MKKEFSILFVDIFGKFDERHSGFFLENFTLCTRTSCFGRILVDFVITNIHSHFNEVCIQ